MANNLTLSGVLDPGIITSVTLLDDIVPTGQTRVYEMKLLVKTDTFEYVQAWKQFTIFNTAGTVTLLNGTPDVITDFIDPVLAGVSINVSMSTNHLVISVGEPTTPIYCTVIAFLTWDVC